MTARELGRITNPLRLLDLYDAQGRIDNQKLFPAILFFVVIVLQFMGRQFTPWILSIVGSIAFGPRMFGMYLRHSQFRAQALQADVTQTVNQTITARRDEALGAEATP